MTNAKKRTLYTIIGVTVLSTQLVTVSALDYHDLEELMIRNEERQLFEEDTYDPSFSKVQMDKLEEQDSDISLERFQRILQGDTAPSSQQENEANCYTSIDREKPNRYCIIDNTPREHTFLVLACPSIADDNDYSNCACAVGIGEPDDAPGTETCNKCTFCRDSTLAYDCRNVAEGTCVGINCRGECVSSLLPEQPLEDLSSTATTTNKQVIGVIYSLSWAIVLSNVLQLL